MVPYKPLADDLQRTYPYLELLWAFLDRKKNFFIFNNDKKMYNGYPRESDMFLYKCTSYMCTVPTPSKSLNVFFLNRPDFILISIQVQFKRCLSISALLRALQSMSQTNSQQGGVALQSRAPENQSQSANHGLPNPSKWNLCSNILINGSSLVCF